MAPVRKRKSTTRKQKKGAASSLHIIEYPMPEVIPVDMKRWLHSYNGCETPAKLYKFERPEPERVSALLNGLAYFSSPQFFNDTEDCGLAIDYDLSDEDIYTALEPTNRWLAQVPPWKLHASTSQDSFNEDFNSGYSIAYFKSMQKDYKIGGIPRVRRRLLKTLAEAAVMPAKSGGIYCVTDSWENELMWSRYACGGSGFALEFDTNTSPVCWDAGKVRYVDQYPRIRLHESAVSGTVMQDILRIPLTKLRGCWENEREWRTWRRKPGFYRYPHSSLISIIFGPKMDPGLQCRILASFIPRYGFRVGFYETKYSDGHLIRIPI
jgi:hypothetical protein